MSYGPKIPRSLVKPAGTRTEQALFTDLTATNGAPTDAVRGYETNYRRNLHLYLFENNGGTATARVWARSGEAPWGILHVYNSVTGAAIPYTVPITASETQWQVLDVHGAEHIYIEVYNFASNAHVSAWAYVNDDVA